MVFVQSGNTLVSLGSLPNRLFSDGTATNASGVVVGTAFGFGAGQDVAIIHRDGALQPIDPSPTRTSRATGINERRQVVGAAGTSIAETAFLWADGVARDLGTLGGPVSIANGINASGEICGTSSVKPASSVRRAFRYADGRMTDLGGLPGSLESSASAINDAGQIVGYSFGPTFEVSAVMFWRGEVRDLGSTAGMGSSALGVNNLGHVVGASFATGVPFGIVAFLHDGSRMYDLNALVVSGLEGRVLNVAAGINDRGQIVAYSDGFPAASFRLDPLAEPPVVVVSTLSGWSLAITCLLLILTAATRRRARIIAAMKQTFLDFEQPIAELQQKIDELRFVHEDSAVDISDEIARLTKKSQQLTKEIYAKLSAWQIAQVARHPQRPYTLDYVAGMFSDFRELHGDRTYADDPAIVGGLARFNGMPCMVIGHQKGRDTKEKIHRNFGMPRPEGYRKALRLMKLAEKFGLPLFTFVDTPGAYPGIGAEERGQSEAIGRNLYEMAGLRIPVIVTVIGEGGSGGALAHRDRRRHAHAAVRDVLGHLAGRLRVDPVEVGRARAGGRRDPGHHRAAAEAARPHRQGRQRAAGRRAPRSRGDDGDAQEGADRGAAATGRSCRSTRCSSSARTASSATASSRRFSAG